MVKTIYKAAAMAELWNHDVWRLLMQSEMMVRDHDGDGLIFARLGGKRNCACLVCDRFTCQCICFYIKETEKYEY
jgi:hypothetical protein